jgi:competence protein ComEC
LGLGIGLFSIKIPPQEGKGTYEGFVLEARANYFFFVSKGVRYYVVEKESTREKGDVLSIEGKAAPYEGTEYESRFSFKEYLAKNGISDQLSAYKITVKFQLPLRLRAKEVSFLSHFSKEGADAIDALLFNHKDYSSSFIQKASSLGCLYFLSLSGLLYGGVLRGSEKLLSLKLKDKQTHAICWVFALLLLPFGLGKAGFWRVFLSRSYHLYAERKGLRSPPHFFVLSILGIVSLLLNRYFALDSGFLLGYGLAFSLSLSQDILERYPGKKKALMSSLFVSFFLFPMLANKGVLHLLSLLYSLLLMPLVYPFAFLSLVSFLSVPFVGFLTGYARLLASVVDCFEKIDLLIPLGNWSVAFTVGYYLFFGAFSIISGNFNARLLQERLSPRGIGPQRSDRPRGICPIGNAVSEQVSFINVGQGDAILIRSGYINVMIDTGGNIGFDLAQEVDIPYLRKEKIYHLDCLIASHSDYDHIGAGASLSKHFRVNQFVDKMPRRSRSRSGRSDLHEL